MAKGQRSSVSGGQVVASCEDGVDDSQNCYIGDVLRGNLREDAQRTKYDGEDDQVADPGPFLFLILYKYCICHGSYPPKKAPGEEQQHQDQHEEGESVLVGRGDVDTAQAFHDAQS
ncbi:hypothetical protein ES708_33219 [subsurface metagenome]